MDIPLLSLPLIVIILTALVSVIAFSSPSLIEKLIFNPFRIKRRHEYYRFLTSGFIHGHYPHLIFNMFTLYFFAPVVEQQYQYYFGERLGMIYFLLVYLGAIIVGGFSDYFKYQDHPHYNALGASGGVSGILMASVLMAPLNKLYLMFIPIGIPGFIFGVLYLLFSYHQSRHGQDNIGHAAHLWGAVFGVALTALLRPAFLMEFVEQISQWRLF
ncbi:MAG: rhomboid family intramembrane serine protease [Bernardetiaceae bacterium]